MVWRAPVVAWSACVAGCVCRASMGIVLGRVQTDSWDCLLQRRPGPFLPARGSRRRLPLLVSVFFTLAIPIRVEARYETSGLSRLAPATSGVWMAVSSYYVARALQMLNWAKRKEAEGHGRL